MLKDILKAEYIKINESCNDWEDAINHAGNILLEKGNIPKKSNLLLCWNNNRACILFFLYSLF